MVYAGVRVRGSVHCNDFAMLLMSYDCHSLCQRQLINCCVYESRLSGIVPVAELTCI